MDSKEVSEECGVDFGQKWNWIWASVGMWVGVGYLYVFLNFFLLRPRMKSFQGLNAFNGWSVGVLLSMWGRFGQKMGMVLEESKVDLEQVLG